MAIQDHTRGLTLLRSHCCLRLSTDPGLCVHSSIQHFGEEGADKAIGLHMKSLLSFCMCHGQDLDFTYRDLCTNCNDYQYGTGLMIIYHVFDHVTLYIIYECILHATAATDARLSKKVGQVLRLQHLRHLLKRKAGLLSRLVSFS